MRPTAWAFLLLCAVLSGPANADPVQFECGETEAGGGGPPITGTVKAYLVYVSYPGDPDSSVAVSANHSISEMNEWLTFASNGLQSFDLSVLRRLDDPNKAWKLGSHPDGNPTGSYIGNWPAANQDIMKRIYNRYFEANGTSIWQGVHRVFMVHYACVTTRCAPNCCASGRGSLSVVAPPEWGFTGRGVTLMTLGSEVTDATVPRLDGGFIHEYGHTLFQMNHPPFSGNPPDYNPNALPPNNIPFGACGNPNGNWTYVNMGSYDNLRGIGPTNGASRGLVGFHPVQMVKTGWLTEVEITDDIKNLHVPDVHSTNMQNPAKVFRVVPRNPVSNAAQAFLLVNHQKTGLDTRLQGAGLLIWHLLRNGNTQEFGADFQFSGVKAWDLESAEGKFAGGWPNGLPSGAEDPVSGKDHLEGDWCWLGSDRDFFNDGQIGDPSPPPAEHMKTVMAQDTNPNTNLYSSANFSTGVPPQSVVSSIAFENIHKDPLSTDMIVDVYVTPKQYVTSPNGGELVPSGQPFTMTWQRRPHAGITTVNLAVSSDGGASFSSVPGGLGLPNPAGTSNTIGTFTTAGPIYFTTLGTQWKARVTSFDATMNAEDVSDATFTVWGIYEDATFQPVISHRCLNGVAKVKVTSTWTTSIASDGDDQIQIYTSSNCAGTPIGTQTVTNPSHTPKTAHSVVWEVSCTLPPGTPIYIVAKSQHGSSWSATQCTYVGTATCISCGGQCNPPCEFD